MRRSRLERIKDQIRLRRYDMTFHAVEEMAEDDLSIADVEHAVLAGQLVEVQKGDPKGNRYVLEGLAADGKTPVV